MDIKNFTKVLFDFMTWCWLLAAASISPPSMRVFALLILPNVRIAGLPHAYQLIKWYASVSNTGSHQARCSALFTLEVQQIQGVEIWSLFLKKDL
jgi:hypothetical protein